MKRKEYYTRRRRIELTQLGIKEKRRKGESQRGWIDRIKEDLTEEGLEGQDVDDRSKQREHSGSGDPI